MPARRSGWRGRRVPKRVERCWRGQTASGGVSRKKDGGSMACSSISTLRRSTPRWTKNSRQPRTTLSNPSISARASSFESPNAAQCDRMLYRLAARPNRPTSRARSRRCPASHTRCAACCAGRLSRAVWPTTLCGRLRPALWVLHRPCSCQVRVPRAPRVKAFRPLPTSRLLR